MSKAILFLLDGVEEIEAVGTTDVLRRGNVNVTMASLTGERHVKGSHGIILQTDVLFEEAQGEEYDMLILPGGPGTASYKNHKTFLDYVKRHSTNGKHIAAICAAPTILGMLGLLEGKRAVCYPGMENELTGSVRSTNDVETDGTIITANGPGTTLLFALELLQILEGHDVMDNIAKGMLIK